MCRRPQRCVAGEDHGDLISLATCRRKVGPPMLGDSIVTDITAFFITASQALRSVAELKGLQGAGRQACRAGLYLYKLMSTSTSTLTLRLLHGQRTGPHRFASHPRRRQRSRAWYRPPHSRSCPGPSFSDGGARTKDAAKKTGGRAHTRMLAR